MRRLLTKFVATVVVMVMLLPCIPAFAESVQGVTWTTENGNVSLANAPNGVLPDIDCTKNNNVKVTFSGDTADYATLIVVPVTDGVAEPPTSENVIMFLQMPVTAKVAEFNFQLKPSMSSGIYAVHIGGTNAEYVTKYFYVTDRSIAWTADGKTIRMVDTPNGNLSAINLSMVNNMKITFTNSEVDYSTIIIVPVTDGIAEPPTSENVVMFLQQPVTNGVAEFNFQLKPTTADGIYAMYTGGTNTRYMTGYFEVSNKIAPTLISGQMYQYDDYKDSIKLKFSSGSNVNFEGWAADKGRITVKLSNGDVSTTVQPEMLRFDTDEKSMTISALGYSEIIPAFGSSIEGNIQNIDVSVETAGYWTNGEFGGTDNNSIKFVAPEVSAEGFKTGVPFEIELYSDNDLSGANAIVALYDDGSLVDFRQEENISIGAGETKTVEINMQSDNLTPSGKFSIKVMLWNGFSAEPLTSFVLFP